MPDFPLGEANEVVKVAEQSEYDEDGKQGAHDRQPFTFPDRHTGTAEYVQILRPDAVVLVQVLCCKCVRWIRHI